MFGCLSNELNQDLLPEAFCKLSRRRLHVNAPCSPSRVRRRGKAAGLVDWRRVCVGGRLMSLTHSWRASRRPRHGREQGCAEAFSHDARPPGAVLSVAKTLRIDVYEYSTEQRRVTIDGRRDWSEGGRSATPQVRVAPPHLASKGSAYPIFITTSTSPRLPGPGPRRAATEQMASMWPPPRWQRHRQAPCLKHQGQQ